jgi:hypothetical protein
MTQIQSEIIDRIKASGGIIVVEPYGIYTRFGKYIAFCGGYSLARDIFLKKYFSPFTIDELAKIEKQHKRNLSRYKRLAIICLRKSKFKEASKLSTLGADLQESMKTPKQYFRLRGALTDGTI